MSVTRAVSRLAAATFLSAGALAVACSSADGPSTSFIAPSPMARPPATAIPPPTGPGMPFEAPCPGYDPPMIGSSCNEAQAFEWKGSCEYGHDLDRACNDIYECTNGQWRRSYRPSCSGRCPETFAEIVPGAACSDITMGCSYLEGTCACVPDADAGTGDGDADADVGPLSGVWRCMPPPGNGCPAQRPAVGSDCVRAMTCDYGACALGRDVVYSCIPTTRSWVQADFPACE